MQYTFPKSFYTEFLIVISHFQVQVGNEYFQDFILWSIFMRRLT
jgi:hypothetical protein